MLGKCEKESENYCPNSHATNLCQLRGEKKLFNEELSPCRSNSFVSIEQEGEMPTKCICFMDRKMLKGKIEGEKG
jgi:hypothetical protein